MHTARILMVFLLVSAGCARNHRIPLPSPLLPEAQLIQGVVVNANGEPIEDAHIDHSGVPRISLETNPQGEFHVETKAPALVVRKDGYRSQFLRTEGNAKVRVVLERDDRIRSFPTCPLNQKCQSLEGFGAVFCFPLPSGVRANKQANGIDHGIRAYHVRTPTGNQGIEHAGGPLWSSGYPLDSQVWRSAEYVEVVYQDPTNVRLPVLDVRGRQSDGTRWRKLGRFGETAQYEDVDDRTAQQLDQVLDSACAR